jgi:aryl-alcohol dehydrogenase-like predicted oxidoreductase
LPTDSNFIHTTLGRTGLPVHRLGLATTNWPGKSTIYRALEAGVNFFFGFGIDYQLISVLRSEFSRQREKLILATGAYNLILGHPNLQRTLEKRLRQFKTDYIDIVMFLGVTQESHLPLRVREELYRLKETGKVRYLGLSCHDRKFVGKLAAEGVLDVLMLRYNAAHRGAEQDIFPFLNAHQPGVMSYTATRWRYLLQRPKNWPASEPIPTPSLCYRFVLSNPNVHVALTAPSNLKQFEENLNSLQAGPLNPDEMQFMQRFGAAVHHTKKWFM